MPGFRSDILAPEAKILIVLYKVGQATAPTIITFTGLAKATVYYNLRRLLEKKLVYTSDGKVYSITDIGIKKVQAMIQDLAFWLGKEIKEVVETG